MFVLFFISSLLCFSKKKKSSLLFIFFCFFFSLFGECASSMSSTVKVGELWTLRIRPKDSAVHVWTFFWWKYRGCFCLLVVDDWLRNASGRCIWVVPCLSDIGMERENERLTNIVGIKKLWRFLKASNWAHLSPYLVPLPLIPPKILKKNYHSLLPCLNMPRVWTGRFCGPCWTDEYENIFAKLIFLSAINLIKSIILLIKKSLHG